MDGVICTNRARFRDGLDKGFRYFGLLATDLDAYGRDLEYNLVDLLVEMTKEKGDYNIGLRSVIRARQAKQRFFGHTRNKILIVNR